MTYFKNNTCSLCRTILLNSKGKHGVSSIWYILRTRPCCQFLLTEVEHEVDSCYSSPYFGGVPSFCSRKEKIYLVEEMWWNHLDSTPH